MFGFSISKLIVLAAVIAAVWYGFKFIGRLDKARKLAAKLTRDAARDVAGAEPAAEPAAETEDMERCEVCDAYVSARDPASCGRADCPYPG